MYKQEEKIYFRFCKRMISTSESRHDLSLVKNWSKTLIFYMPRYFQQK